MKKLRLLGIVFLIVVLALVGSVQAQDATDEPTPTVEATAAATVVSEVPPVVVIDNGPSEDHLTWRELGLYALVSIAVITLAVVAYRLVTMVGRSYPPGTSESLVRLREKAEHFTQTSDYLWDDLAFYLADPLVKNAIQAVKEREAVAAIQPSPPDGTAVG